MKWWGINVICPKCSKDAVLQYAQHSADGELRFTAYCFDCKEVIIAERYGSYLQWSAGQKDLEAERAAKQQQKQQGQQNPGPGKPIRPPLSRVAEDDKFLKRLGIGPGPGSEEEDKKGGDPPAGP